MDKRQSTKVKRQPLKVVYIGNPRMFKAKDYKEFRQIVQELTGQNPETKTNPIATAITPKVNMKMKNTVKENPEFVYGPPSATSSSATGYVNQEFIYPSSSPEYVNQDLIYPSSSSEYVNQDFTYPSSSGDFAYEDSVGPSSSSSEYIDPDFSHLDSSCTEFLEDFFSVEMLENYGQFM